MKRVPIRPMPGKVLVERSRAAHVSEGGIHLPDVAQAVPTEGIVVSVGARVSVRVGDRVMFGMFSGQKINHAEREFLIFDEADLIAVLDDAPWPKVRA